MSYARAAMVCMPLVRPRPVTVNVGPPFAATTAPSIDQSTSMTAGSMTLTVSVAGFATVPVVAGSVASIGTTWRQMSMIIFSRDTQLKLVFTLSPNRLFIIELTDGR